MVLPSSMEAFQRYMLQQSNTIAALTEMIAPTKRITNDKRTWVNESADRR